MTDLRDALFYLDLDKGTDSPEPSTEEPRQRLERDPELRAGWSQYQALKALAWETAPEPTEKLVKQALMLCRREHVGRRLAQAAGSDELARELLLGKTPAQKGLPTWAWGLFLVGALGLGWMSLRRSSVEQAPTSVASSRPATASVEEPLNFEFNPQTRPAEAALAQPIGSGEGDSEDVHHETAAAAQARQLVRQHLQQGKEPKDAGRTAPNPAAKPKIAQRAKELKSRAVPIQAASSTPRPQPTALAATAVPTALPTAVAMPTASHVQAAMPGAGAVVVGLEPPAPIVIVPEAGLGAAPSAPGGLSSAQAPVPDATVQAAPVAPATAAASPALVAAADLSLSASTLSSGRPVLITLGAPAEGGVDLRVFDLRGRSVRRLAEGTVPAGPNRYTFDGKDDTGASLVPGTYYLRAMTPWFSRVEALEIQ